MVAAFSALSSKTLDVTRTATASVTAAAIPKLGSVVEKVSNISVTAAAFQEPGAAAAAPSAAGPAVAEDGSTLE